MLFVTPAGEEGVSFFLITLPTPSAMSSAFTSRAAFFAADASTGLFTGAGIADFFTAFAPSFPSAGVSGFFFAAAFRGGGFGRRRRRRRRRRRALLERGRDGVDHRHRGERGGAAEQRQNRLGGEQGRRARGVAPADREQRSAGDDAGQNAHRIDNARAALRRVRRRDVVYLGFRRFLRGRIDTHGLGRLRRYVIGASYAVRSLRSRRSRRLIRPRRRRRLLKRLASASIAWDFSLSLSSRSASASTSSPAVSAADVSAELDVSAPPATSEPPRRPRRTGEARRTADPSGDLLRAAATAGRRARAGAHEDLRAGDREARAEGSARASGGGGDARGSAGADGDGAGRARGDRRHHAEHPRDLKNEQSDAAEVRGAPTSPGVRDGRRDRRVTRAVRRRAACARVSDTRGKCPPPRGATRGTVSADG